MAGATRTIPLEAPLSELILYWTASTDQHGELHLHHNVFDCDAVLRALQRR